MDLALVAVGIFLYLVVATNEVFCLEQEVVIRIVGLVKTRNPDLIFYVLFLDEKNQKSRKFDAPYAQANSARQTFRPPLNVSDGKHFQKLGYYNAPSSTEIDWNAPK